MIGIVIPAYNEEILLPGCLRSLRPFIDSGDAVIAIDAASQDDTAKVAQSFGVTVLHSKNSSRGYAIEKGVMYLLEQDTPWEAVIIGHADMQFMQDSREVLLSAVNKNPESPGGSFGHRIDAPGICFRLIEWGNRLRAKWFQMPYGDQAQFFCPNRVEEKFKFPSQDTLEDVEISLRLRKSGMLLYLDHPVLIPARHWPRSFYLKTVRNWWIVLLYLIRRTWNSFYRVLFRRFFQVKTSPFQEMEVDRDEGQGKMH